MIDTVKTGKKIALLRKEKGLTGEKLAALLDVSPQAISKWENGKCLPETSLLPALANTLGCSIDSLLMPRELFILEAVYTDGCTHIPVTGFIDSFVRGNELSITICSPFIGEQIESSRLKLLTVKYQTPDGIFFTYALQNETLHIAASRKGENFEKNFHEKLHIIGAYYGNEKDYSSAMTKIRHYEYFDWEEIPVNHETFPSSTSSDDTEYLLLVYLSGNGIHAISCAENSSLQYDHGRTFLRLKDTSKCILPDIMPLAWGMGMDCTWAGALYAALTYMGEPCTYQQLMGLSGACYRICFTDIWDFSCTDALVAYDYAEPLYRALGYTPVWADRLDKEQRKEERLAIMKDIRNGKPVLAINLRVAPEWGVITGYLDNGRFLLCRTYFDQEIYDQLVKKDCEDRQITFDDRGGYLVNDFWPFLIIHFGPSVEKRSPAENFKASLLILADSFRAESRGSYYQGKQAYDAWIDSLSEDSLFDCTADEENAERRLCVNDCMLVNLIDAPRCDSGYIRRNLHLLPEAFHAQLQKLADNYGSIYESLTSFREKVTLMSGKEIFYNQCRANGVSTAALRKEQIQLLKEILMLEQENCSIADTLNAGLQLPAEA